MHLLTDELRHCHAKNLDDAMHELVNAGFALRFDRKPGSNARGASSLFLPLNIGRGLHVARDAGDIYNRVAPFVAAAVKLMRKYGTEVPELRTVVASAGSCYDYIDYIPVNDGGIIAIDQAIGYVPYWIAAVSAMRRPWNDLELGNAEDLRQMQLAFTAACACTGRVVLRHRLGLAEFNTHPAVEAFCKLSDPETLGGPMALLGDPYGRVVRSFLQLLASRAVAYSVGDIDEIRGRREKIGNMEPSGTLAAVWCCSEAIRAESIGMISATNSDPIVSSPPPMHWPAICFQVPIIESIMLLLYLDAVHERDQNPWNKFLTGIPTASDRLDGMLKVFGAGRSPFAGLGLSRMRDDWRRDLDVLAYILHASASMGMGTYHGSERPARDVNLSDRCSVLVQEQNGLHARRSEI